MDLRAELTSTVTYSWLKILKGPHFECIYSVYTELCDFQRNKCRLNVFKVLFRQPLLIGKTPEKNYNTHNTLSSNPVTKLWNPTRLCYTIRNQQYRLDCLHLVCHTLQKNEELCGSGLRLMNNSKDPCEG